MVVQGDAAATLCLLNDFWATGFAPNELHQMGAMLGADVPVFLGTEQAYRGEGIGDKLTPLPSSYHFPFFLVIVMPEVSISTPEAYGWVVPSEESRPDLLTLVASNDLAHWREELINDFEQEVAGRYPVIASLKASLYGAGAGYAALSGSGAAMFGVFTEPGRADAAAARFTSLGYRSWAG